MVINDGTVREVQQSLQVILTSLCQAVLKKKEITVEKKNAPSLPHPPALLQPTSTFKIKLDVMFCTVTQLLIQFHFFEDARK